MVTEREERIEAIKDGIREAFATADAAPPERIVSHDCWECRRIQRRFQGKRWRDVPLASLASEDPLTLLTPEAFCFYLPAFMLAALDHHDKGGLVSCTIFCLTPSEPSEGPEMMEWFLERVEILRPAQRERITQFLTVLRNDYADGDDITQEEIDEALTFWQAYAGPTKPPP